MIEKKMKVKDKMNQVDKIDRLIDLQNCGIDSIN